MPPALHTSDVFAASLAAEFAQRALLHPVDTIKARLQYMQFPRPAGGQQRLPRLSQLPLVGDIAALRADAECSSMRNFSVRSLYRGLAPALIGVVPSALVYMPTYEVSKAALSGTPFAGLAGCITGCACACVRVPVSVVKAKVQLQLYDGPLAALRASISGPSGLRGLYAGLGATLVHDVAYAAIQFALLERLRLVADGLVGGRALTATEDGMVGFSVGLCTAALTEPLDLVRTRLMVQKQQVKDGARAAAHGGGGSSGAAGRSFGYRGVFHGLASAAGADGLVSLWRGLLPRLFLKSVGSSVWYTVYMASRRHLAERRADEAPDGAAG